MERCRHTGVKPPFRDTEDTDTQTPQPHSDTCCDRAPGPHVDLCGGVGHTAKALRGDTHGDIPTYALVSTLTHTHTATRREAHTGFADSKTHGQFLTLLDLMCVLCLQGEPGDPGEDGRKVSCPRLESALAQTGAGSEAALSSLGREGRFGRPWKRSECWRLLQSLTPEPDPVIRDPTPSRGLRVLMLAASSTGS